MASAARLHVHPYRAKLARTVGYAPSLRRLDATAAAATILLLGSYATLGAVLWATGLRVDWSGLGALLAASAVVLAIGLVWGFTVVADSAQFSTLVTEHADQAYVGTALTMQLAVGFTLTVATIWLLPFFADAVGWRWAFAFLVPGPALGVVAMLRLRR